jgi:hypothetical protein
LRQLIAETEAARQGLTPPKRADKAAGSVMDDLLLGSSGPRAEYSGIGDLSKKIQLSALDSPLNEALKKIQASSDRAFAQGGTLDRIEANTAIMAQKKPDLAAADVGR